MIPLGQILNADWTPERDVCRGPVRTWAGLRTASSGVLRALPQGDAKPWLLAVNSTFQFVASLLACWQARIPVMLSPDSQPATLEQLRPLISGCLTDHLKTEPGVPVIRVDGMSAETIALESLPPCTVMRGEDELALELFTSGSTGRRKRVPKTFAQLDNELLVLQQHWSGECQGRTPLATVSHDHLYGLLFNVLWPLCRGDAFHDQIFFFWEELLGQIPNGPVTIISSPAHLRHLPQAARQIPRDWSRTSIFSSGGPLPLTTALEVMAVCGRAPIEVYGSTETGGIASRQQREGVPVLWRPLPGVDFKIEDGLLAVRSNRLPNPDVWCVTNDRAETAGGDGFLLAGRSDRIVKILEKRVSLEEMDAVLSKHPAVQDSCGVLLPVKEVASREVLGMVIELTERGRDSLAGHGKSALTTDLRRHLERHFEAVTLPRRWRFVEKLPRDAQGKTSCASLVELFHAESRPTNPEILEREQTESGSRVRLRVPANLAFLEGHFPQLAVVPGVCQLKWVIEEIERFCGKRRAVSHLEAVKFFELLTPGQEFCLEFARKADTGKWTYRLFRGERKISSGRIQFAI